MAQQIIEKSQRDPYQYILFDSCQHDATPPVVFGNPALLVRSDSILQAVLKIQIWEASIEYNPSQNKNLASNSRRRQMLNHRHTEVFRGFKICLQQRSWA